MKCPVCQKEMKVSGKDISNNFKTGQKYNRTVYYCADCDTWGNTEIPIEIKVKKDMKPKVYLAGQANEHEKNWKEDFKKLSGFEFYDWEFQSNQTSPDTFYPDDLRAVKNTDVLIANPGIAPSEATWIEIGYFLANNTDKPGDSCRKLIIIWKEERLPKWSIEFVKKAGVVVDSVEKAKMELEKLR